MEDARTQETIDGGGLRLLKLIMERDGKPIRLDEVSIDPFIVNRMCVEGLYTAEQTGLNTFEMVITEMGIIFLREHTVLCSGSLPRCRTYSISNIQPLTTFHALCVLH